MKLAEWLGVLRSASRPLDTVELRNGAMLIAGRAQALTGNKVMFRVTSTTTGVRISAYPPSVMAQRALRRAVDEHLDEIKGQLANQARERLTSG